MSFEKRENFTQNILTNLLNNTPTNYLLCSLWVMCKKYLSVCYAFWEMRVKKNRESCYTHPHITTREIICEIFWEILRKCEIKRVGTKTVEHREHIYSQKKLVRVSTAIVLPPYDHIVKLLTDGGGGKQNEKAFRDLLCSVERMYIYNF